MLPLNYVCTHRQTVCSVVSLQIWESGEYKVPAPGISFLSAVRSFFLSEIWSQAVSSVIRGGLRDARVLSDHLGHILIPNVNPL